MSLSRGVEAQTVSIRIVFRFQRFIWIEKNGPHFVFPTRLVRVIEHYRSACAAEDSGARVRMHRAAHRRVGGL